MGATELVFGLLDMMLKLSCFQAKEKNARLIYQGIGGEKCLRNRFRPPKLHFVIFWSDTEVFTIYAWRWRAVIVIVITISSFVASIAEARVVVCAINTATCRQRNRPCISLTSNLVNLTVYGTCTLRFEWFGILTRVFQLKILHSEELVSASFRIWCCWENKKSKDGKIKAAGTSEPWSHKVMETQC